MTCVPRSLQGPPAAEGDSRAPRPGRVSHRTGLLCALTVVLALAAATVPADARRLAAAAPAPAPAGAAVCPPPGFDAVPDLNVSAYISQPWYVLAQTPLIYQPRDQLYCTQARYEPVDPADPLQGLKVINYSKQGGVGGPAVSTGSGPSLLGTVPDRGQPSKLSVGFDFPGASQLAGTQFGSGPYWVVATGDDGAGGYDWAIVMSGPPDAHSGGACAFSSSFSSGVWLFSRAPEDPALLESLTEVLREDLGFDTSLLVPVTQAGCTYD